jgi:hypothetical protein
MLPKFELPLIHREEIFLSKLINTRTSISDTSSENNCEDDISGSDDDFLGFFDEYIILWFVIFLHNNPAFFQ